MIKPNELRIGNKIYPLSDCPDVVDVIDIDEGGRIGTTAFFDGYKGTCDTSTESACGIPLTPEWLVRCGFEKDKGQGKGKGTYWEGPQYEFDNEVDCFSIVESIEPNSYRLFGSEWAMGRSFHYLHQLQNLYFALTGEELTIKEKV